MTPQEIYITETIGVPRNREFVRVGVPCAKGAFSSVDGLQLLTTANEALPVQATILKKWHDGSVKWLLFDFAATVPAHERVVYRLAKNSGLMPTVPCNAGGSKTIRLCGSGWEASLSSRTRRYW